MALTPRRTLSASTLDPQQFQLFQPRGEVRAIVSPTRMRKGFSAAPLEMAAFSTTRYSVFADSLPVIRPVLGSSRRPAGRSVAEKESGRSPVAGIRYRKGELGRRPKMEGPLIRGWAAILACGFPARWRETSGSSPQNSELPDTCQLNECISIRTLANSRPGAPKR